VIYLESSGALAAETLRIPLKRIPLKRNRLFMSDARSLHIVSGLPAVRPLTRPCGPASPSRGEARSPLPLREREGPSAQRWEGEG